MLLVLASLPLLASALLGLGAPWAGRRLPPSAAVKVLTTAAFATALATGFSLAVVAFNAVARIPLVAALGQWSTAALGLDGTPPPVGGVLLGLVVAGLLVAALRRSLRTAKDLAVAVLAGRRLHDLSDGLVLVDDDAPDAFALPGLRGKVVVTTGMLRALGPAERRVVIAHEQAHLSDHHQVYIQAAALAAAANPLLSPVATQVRLLAERWADEQAALEVGDRGLAARALARAALARRTHTRAGASPALALGAADGDVAARVLALTRPRPRPRPRLAGALLALAASSLLASLWIGHSTEVTFERAHHAWTDHLGGASLRGADPDA